MTVSEPQAGARLYVTEIWCPPADSGVHALYSRMPEPEPLPEPEPEADMTTLEPRIEAAFFAAEPEDRRLPSRRPSVWSTQPRTSATSTTVPSFAPAPRSMRRCTPSTKRGPPNPSWRRSSDGAPRFP